MLLSNQVLEALSVSLNMNSRYARETFCRKARIEIICPELSIKDSFFVKKIEALTLDYQEP